jgi:radical SAM superfamily enzyme YgiQ (UPF0313 family)
MYNEVDVDESNIHKGYDIQGVIQNQKHKIKAVDTNVFQRLKQPGSKKLLLITPTSDRLVGVTKWLSANLGIERLSGYLNANGHTAECYDTNLYKCTEDGPTLEDRFREGDWDIIGFSVLDDTKALDISNMYLAQKYCPNALLIAGGAAAQFDYQTVLDKSPCQIVVIGEGEKVVQQIADGESLENIKGIIFKSANVPLTPEEFLEATNALDYANVPYENYWDYYLELYRAKGEEITPLISSQIHTIRVFSRNYCPIGCKFCSSTNILRASPTDTNTIKVVDIVGDKLVDLLKKIVKAHPRVETIYFTDDDFCLQKGKLMDFLKLLIKENLPLSFISFARITDLDDDVISHMAKANFRSLNVGIENFQQEILDEFSKKLKVERIDGVLELLKKHGIQPACSFILCSPKAKLQWVENTALRIKKELDNGTLEAGIMVTTQPLKGSYFYEEYTEFESDLIPVEGTDLTIKRDYFIKCLDPEVRELQYRYLFRWSDFIDKAASEGHLNAQMQSPQALALVLQLIDEIKKERGSKKQYKYTNMPTVSRRKAWSKYMKYNYSTGL